MNEFDRGIKLLLGTVWHHRLTEPQNQFRYKVLYVETDLLNWDPEDSTPLIFSYDRLNFYALNERDHYHDETEGFRSAIPRLMTETVSNSKIKRIRMITQPSVLGYVFNPVTFFIGEGMDDRPNVVVAEVHNRVGQRHLYVMQPEPVADGVKPLSFQKQFYVSPFLDMDGTYKFSMSRKNTRLTLNFDLIQAKKATLETTLNLQYMRISTWALLRAFLTHSLIPQKTTLAIYWQALRLKLKGYRYRRPPDHEEPK
jgi:DUF1365 family protein